LPAPWLLQCCLTSCLASTHRFSPVAAASVPESVIKATALEINVNQVFTVGPRNVNDLLHV
jgi:hypothetical protein